MPPAETRLTFTFVGIKISDVGKYPRAEVVATMPEADLRPDVAFPIIRITLPLTTSDLRAQPTHAIGERALQTARLLVNESALQSWIQQLPPT